MKSNKTILLTVLAVGGMLACVSVRAQENTNTPAVAPSTNAAPHHPMMMRGPSMDRLAQMLNLTPDQKAKVEPVIDQRNEKMRAVFQDQTLSRDDKMAKIKQIRSDTDTQMKAILNDDQFAQWQKLTQPRQRRPMTPPPAAPGASAAPGAPNAPAPSGP